MKQYDESNEYDQTLKSLNSIKMEKSDKEEVYSNLINNLEKRKVKTGALIGPSMSYQLRSL
ncbi:hypothetical protein [Bacillus sp. P14.5]|uniref:hypothetical protein n=1 Tax=Bacillus sp. P14.5 TaxID=1983400 RepID=UPI000DE934B1|nr:hypothetical protein [Bacillus sp. P14.5]